MYFHAQIIRSGHQLPVERANQRVPFIERIAVTRRGRQSIGDGGVSGSPSIHTHPPEIRAFYFLPVEPINRAVIDVIINHKSSVRRSTRIVERGAKIVSHCGGHISRCERSLDQWQERPIVLLTEKPITRSPRRVIESRAFPCSFRVRAVWICWVAPVFPVARIIHRRNEIDDIELRAAGSDFLRYRDFRIAGRTAIPRAQLPVSPIVDFAIRVHHDDRMSRPIARHRPLPAIAVREFAKARSRRVLEDDVIARIVELRSRRPRPKHANKWRDRRISRTRRRRVRRAHHDALVFIQKMGGVTGERRKRVVHRILHPPLRHIEAVAREILDFDILGFSSRRTIHHFGQDDLFGNSDTAAEEEG